MAKGNLLALVSKWYCPLGQHPAAFRQWPFDVRFGRRGQAASKPGHARYAAEAEVSKRGPGERSDPGPCRD